MTQFDYKWRPQPMDILNEVFTHATKNFDDIMTRVPLYKGQKSSDGLTYNLAIEIPRLVKDTISVEIEEDLKSTSQFRRIGYPSYNIIIKAAQNLISSYLNENQESVKKRYEEICTLEGQNVDLNGFLSLSYNEGVLIITIPLTKPIQPKKASLSARLVTDAP